MTESRKRRNLLLQETRLIERYVQMRVHKPSMRIARFIMRYVLAIKEKKRKNALIGALREVVKQAQRTQHSNFESSKVVFNLALFFLIAERDIQAAKIDALTHPDQWQRSLAARVILLTIHELDLDKVAGNKFRNALADAGLSNEKTRQASKALRIVRNAQQKAQKQFAFLRNSTIAHRDADALAQYRSIMSIDEKEVLRIAGEFYDGIKAFLDLLPELVMQVASIPGLLNQLRAGQVTTNKISAEKT